MPARRARSRPCSAVTIASAGRPSSMRTPARSTVSCRRTFSRPVSAASAAPRSRSASAASAARAHGGRGRASRTPAGGSGAARARAARARRWPPHRRGTLAGRHARDRAARERRRLEHRVADRAGVGGGVGGLIARVGEVAAHQRRERQREPQPDPVGRRLGGQLAERDVEPPPRVRRPAEPPLRVGDRDGEREAVGGRRRPQRAEQRLVRAGARRRPRPARRRAGPRSACGPRSRGGAAARRRGSARRSPAPATAARRPRRAAARSRRRRRGRPPARRDGRAPPTPAPRRSIAAAARAWAPSRQPPGVASWTAWRTTGWRNAKRRGASPGRTSERASSVVERGEGRPSRSATSAATSRSNGSPITAAASSRLRASPPSAPSSPRARRRPRAGPCRLLARPRPRAPRRARELLEVERVAAAVGVDRVRRAPHELARLRLAERADLEARDTLERGREPAGASGEGEQHRPVGRARRHRGCESCSRP